MFDILWANGQVEQGYTSYSLLLVDKTTGITYRYEKIFPNIPTNEMLESAATQQIEQLKLELDSDSVDGPIIYEGGIEWQ